MWCAVFGRRVSCCYRFIGCVSCNKFPHFRQNISTWHQHIANLRAQDLQAAHDKTNGSSAVKNRFDSVVVECFRCDDLTLLYTYVKVTCACTSRRMGTERT